MGYSFKSPYRENRTALKRATWWQFGQGVKYGLVARTVHLKKNLRPTNETFASSLVSCMMIGVKEWLDRNDRRYGRSK